MPKRKYPEQRSTTSAPQPGQAPAKPTGDEIYSHAAAGQEGSAEGGLSEEELAELEELQVAASQAYDRLTEAARELSERMTDVYESGRAFIQNNPASTVAGAFAVGIFLGMLSSDD